MTERKSFTLYRRSDPQHYPEELHVYEVLATPTHGEFGNPLAQVVSITARSNDSPLPQGCTKIVTGGLNEAWQWAREVLGALYPGLEFLGDHPDAKLI